MTRCIIDDVRRTYFIPILAAVIVGSSVLAGCGAPKEEKELVGYNAGCADAMHHKAGRSENPEYLDGYNDCSKPSEEGSETDPQ